MVEAPAWAGEDCRAGGAAVAAAAVTAGTRASTRRLLSDPETKNRVESSRRVVIETPPRFLEIATR
jgi:hypothetical protein